MRDAVGILGLGYAGFLFLVVAPHDRNIGDDAYAYWSVDQSHPYQVAEGQFGAFPYPPPLVRVFGLAAHLSWPDFWWLWMAGLIATVAWLGWKQAPLVLAFPPVAIELYHGNVNLLIAAAVALGLRYPATWAFVLLTKVTPGAGLLWLAARREWRNLAIALGVTGAIVIMSLVIDGPLWGEWLAALQRDSSASLGGPLAFPLWIRIAVAGAIVIWGARTDRTWTVPVAATLAMPTLFIAVFSVLAAIPALRRRELVPVARGHERVWRP